MTTLKCKKCGSSNIRISGFITNNRDLNNYNAYWFWCLCNPEKDLNLNDLEIIYD